MDSVDPVAVGAGRGLRVIGVLGGVGSGKSTAARILAEELGAPHLDADAEVGRLYADPRLLQRLKQTFGPELLREDGSLDRTALGQRVFADPAARRRLEALLHPAVRRALWQGLAAIPDGGSAILDVPLLIENGLSKICGFLVFIAVPDSVRAARARARHGWDEATWRAREAAQAPLAQKQAAADAILDNAGGVDDLRAAIRALLPRLRALPPRPWRDRWPDPDLAPGGDSPSP